MQNDLRYKYGFNFSTCIGVTTIFWNGYPFLLHIFPELEENDNA